MSTDTGHLDHCGAVEISEDSAFVVVPYSRFLERRAWRQKMAADLGWIADQCLDVDAVPSAPEQAPRSAAPQRDAIAHVSINQDSVATSGATSSPNTTTPAAAAARDASDASSPPTAALRLIKGADGLEPVIGLHVHETASPAGSNKSEPPHQLA